MKTIRFQNRFAKFSFPSDNLFRLTIVPSVILIISLVMTLYAWFYVRENTRGRYENEFRDHASAVTRLIEMKIKDSLDLLYDIQSLFASSDSVERNKWSTFVAQQRSGKGSILLTDYIEEVQPAALQAFIDSVRSDKSLDPSGYPDFSIYPADASEGFRIVKYVSPDKDFAKLIGFNINADPIRREATQRAMETGKPAATPRTSSLMSGETFRDAFTLYLPIFRNGMPTGTVEERRAAIQGYAAAILDAKKLIAEAVETERKHSNTLHFAVYDSHEKNDEGGDYLLTEHNSGPKTKSGFSFASTVDVADRKWTVEYRSDPSVDYADDLYYHLPWFVLLGGIIFSFLLFGTLLALNSSRMRAVGIAEKMTDELAHSEAQFRAMSEASPLGIFLINESGQGIYTNRVLQQITGAGPRDLEAVGWQSFVHYDDRRRVEAAWSEFIQNGRGTFESEQRFKRKDGSVVWTHIMASPILEADKPRGYIGTVEDISAKKKSEQELIDSETRFRTLTSNIPGVVYRCLNDADWTMEFLSNAIEELSGYPARDFIGNRVRSFASIIHSEDRTMVEQVVQDAIQTKSSYSIEYRILHKMGHVVWVYERGRGVFDVEGRPVCLDGAIFDITDRKKLEAQLAQSQKMEMIGTLAGGVAHDLNNALAPVVGYLDLILQEIKADHSIYPFATNVRQAAQRCIDIVQRLVNFSKPSAQAKSSLDIGKVMQETSYMLKTVLPSSIEVHISSPHNLWPVMGIPGDIESAIMNLATNSRDAIGTAGGKIEITAENAVVAPEETKQNQPGGQYVCIRVKDNGRGIAQENLHRIFEPFFTTKGRGRGTGLGLAMVFNIVKDHNGWVDVASLPGQGTVFTVYLPAALHRSEPSPSGSGVGVLPRGHETVLFVDDEESVRTMGGAFLERLGYHALFACDGEEAVEIFKQHPEIGIVVLDLTMPKIAGTEALKRILAQNPGAKVIVSSGYTDEGNEEDFIRQGARNFLKKPYAIISFAQMLRCTLDGVK